LYGHSCVVDERGGGRLVYFGGCDGKGRFYDDLREYNLERRSSRVIRQVGERPQARCFHSCVVYKHSMYVFGGTSNGIFSDLWRYDFVGEQRWHRVDCRRSSSSSSSSSSFSSSSSSSLTSNKSNSNTTASVSVSDDNHSGHRGHSGGHDEPFADDIDAPKGRFGHSAVVYNDSMYLFGGYTTDGFACNDLYEYSFECNEWRRLKPVADGRSVMPVDLFRHSAVVHQGSMYVFGGYRSKANVLLEYRFGTGAWSLVHTLGSAPKPRYAHTAVVHDGVMYVVGGRDTVANFDDMHEFLFDTLTWNASSARGFDARFFVASAVCDGVLYMHGGQNIFNFSFDGLYRCDLAAKQTPALASDIHRLLDNEALSDVRFIFRSSSSSSSSTSSLRRGKVIYANRNILVARCVTFRGMFRSGMKESQCGDIEIKDVKYKIFRSMLDYIYSGALNTDGLKRRHLVALVACADLYQLPHLKYLCAKRIQRYITAPTAFELIELAYRYSLSTLYDACHEYIVAIDNFEQCAGFDQLRDEIQVDLARRDDDDDDNE
jgi:leucine-zipper-like transcriptional regulator 1